MDDSGDELRTAGCSSATGWSRRSAAARRPRRRGRRPRRRGRHAGARQHPPPPLPDADAGPGAGGDAVRVAARAVPGVGADRRRGRVRGRPDRASPSWRCPAAQRSSTTTTSSRAAVTGLWEAEVQAARELGVRIVASRGLDGPRRVGRRAAAGLAGRADRRDPRRHGAAGRAPGRRRTGAARGRALLAVLGDEGADGRVGGAGPPARAEAAHAPRRDRRGGRVLSGAVRLHAGRVPGRSSAGWPGTSGARTASTCRAADVAAFGRAAVGVAHCPTSNLRLGAGVAPVRELVDAGAPVGLGVDGSASNERSDLFFEVKQALLVARGRGGPARR